ncbi:MAG: polysaccharide biosynthesis tyrosine autokinase [Geminicoccaceae bacterium]|nr:polysaccharide biosynthesis tyrosine autokinase [Geminicoccaceae bacterium]MDW8444027.1 polysaccharide biosynthesis tyrosine autokinase [Acetobacteraceae bacterium]
MRDLAPVKVDLPSTSPPPPESAAVDVLSFLAVLWRRKWLIVVFSLLGATAGWLFGTLRTPLYSATALVVIEPREDRVLDIEKVVGRLPVDERVIATEMGILTSPEHVRRTVRELGLVEDPEFNPFLRPGGSADRLFDPRALFERLLALLPADWLVAMGVAAEPILGGAETEVPPEPVEEVVVAALNKRIRVLNDGRSYLIGLEVSSEEPAKAAQIANHLVEVYLDQQRRAKLGSTTRASSFLAERLKSLRAEVEQAEAAIAKFKAEQDLLDARGMTLGEQELSELNRELIVARGELAERQAKLRLVRELRARGAGLDAISDVASSPVIVDLRAREAELARREAELTAQFGPRHPRMVQLERDRANLQAKVRAEVDRIATQLENDVRVAQAKIATIESQLAAIKGRSARDRQAEVRLKELERQAEAARQLYQAVLQRSKETREEERLVEPDARLVSRATPPLSPSSLGPRVFMLAGLLGSFLVSSGLALVLESLGKGLRSPREVERATGLPTLALVPELALRRRQLPHQYLLDKPLSLYAEAIGSVFVALAGAPSERGRIVLVTSSLPEEGKTTLVVSLGTFAARSGKRVLLLDLDLRHPSVHRTFGWQHPPGVVELLEGAATLEEAIRKDEETGVDFLPVKGRTANPIALLAGERMRELLSRLRSLYDLVLLDTAPVASVTDARILAPLADRVVYVVRWNETPASLVSEEVAALRELGAEFAGVVLARVDLAKHAKYGYPDRSGYYKRSQKYYVN